MQRGLRIFGLEDKPGSASLGLAAVLIVVGAVLLAAFPRQDVATAVGAVLWLIGAAIAVRGWVRIMRLRRRDSS
jgi:protein-S-isoprenylcysteine O-methyltransferase Ste14